MFPSWLQIAIVVILIILLFGRGKISDLMGDVAKGIKSFKKGMADDTPVETAKTIDHTETPVASQSTENKDKV